jgi:hypothetical protein
MSLPGRCVSAGTPVLNYEATNVVPTQEDQPPPIIEEDAQFPNT